MKIGFKTISIFLALLLSINVFAKKPEKQSKSVSISGELKKWHKVILTFQGPEVSENDDYNPFMHYRLNVKFTHKRTRKEYIVPGYFAADGNAANSSATSGNKWRVIFRPDKIGAWKYEVNFRKGKWVAVSDRDRPGESAGFMDGLQGSFNIDPSHKEGRDFRAQGRLEYTGGHYLKFAETGEYFLKVGVDAPENFLAYEDFDGDFDQDGHRDDLVKDWEPHIEDWEKGDPTWKNGRGKGIIGALNYLESEGLNSVSFLTLNIKGDDRNVFPFIDYNTYDRYDVSKLAQWEIVFNHAQKNGIFLHFKTQETENQGLLDRGGVGTHRRLYYRELIARFGHHLALNWNLGEENGDWEDNPITPPQHTMQRRSMAAYFYNHDPYKHHLVIHNGTPFYDLLGNKSKLTGPSIQTHHKNFKSVHKKVLHWRELSRATGKPWAVSVDEPGNAQFGIVPDKIDPEKNKARKNALWGAYMAGAWGVEWYFGYKYDNSDLSCENFRSRKLFWDQCRIARKFFADNPIPYWEMTPKDNLISGGDNYCLVKHDEIYLVYLKNGGNQKLNLERASGKFKIQWFNPREGGELQKGEIETIEAPGKSNLGEPPADKNKDWVVLITNK